MPNIVSPHDPSRSDAVKPTEPFYSALRREIEKQDLRSAPVDGWMQILNGLVNRALVKQDEVEWTGLREWLDMQVGKVSKNSVMAYLDANGVQLREVVLGQRPNEALPAGWALEQDRYGNWQVVNDKGVAVTTPQRRKDDALSVMPSAVIPTKYQTYTLPGGENYREVLLTLPGLDAEAAEELTRAKKRLEAMTDLIIEFGEEGNAKRAKEFEAKASALQDRIAELEKKVKPTKLTGTYKSSHWDQPNVLAHIRMNDRTDADGKRVLFVEEIQSDWGQAGKKNGFDTKADKAKRAELQAEHNRLQEEAFDLQRGKNYNDLTIEESDRLGKIRRRILHINDQLPTRGTPEAPFVGKTDAWVALALRRVIKMAVDEGYDKVAFVNGEQSAQRYDLSKQVDQLLYSANSDGTYRLSAITGSNGKMLGEAIPAEKLEDYIGKEIAQRIINGDGKRTQVQGQYDPVAMVSKTEYMQSLSGLDLQVGGDGMKSFYDKIVPAAVKDVLKKVGGGNLEEVSIGGSATYEQLVEAGKRTGLSQQQLDKMHVADRKALIDSLLPKQAGFTITDSIRDKVATGLPLFSIADGAHSRTDATGSYNTAPETHTVAASKLRESLFTKHGLNEKNSFAWAAVAPPDGDDGRLARSVADTAKSLFGLDVVWIDFQGDPLFNGAISDLAPGKIFLNIRSSKPFMAVLGHEVLHHLQEAQPRIYADLLHGLDKLIRFDGVFASRLQAKYEKHGLTLPESGIHAELAGDIIGDSFTDDRFWAELDRQQSKRNRSISNSVKGWLDKVGVRIGQLRPFGTDEFLVDVQAAHTAIAKALNQFREAVTVSQGRLRTEHKRFNAGADLTPLQRRSVLGTLVDTYKAKGAEREMKGLDNNGNERYGYVYSPELFERSDVTGAMLRYYVVLPDGRRAHPTEVFPHLTPDDVDRMAAEQEAREQKSVEYENAIKPFFNDYDAANLFASRDAVVISKSDRFAVIPDRWGAVAQARSHGWEVTTRPLHGPAEEEPRQRSPACHYAVQKCVKEVDPGVVRTIGYRVVIVEPGVTEAAESEPVFACKRAGLEDLVTAVAEANQLMTQVKNAPDASSLRLTEMPLIRSLEDAGMALPLAAVQVPNMQVETLSAPVKQRLDDEAQQRFETEVHESPETI
jgi:hypothetical protein